VRGVFLEEGRVVLGGTDLGHPTHLAQCPTIGRASLVARGKLAIGDAVWDILDRK
jgi:hypothetical protein